MGLLALKEQAVFEVSQPSQEQLQRRDTDEPRKAIHTHGGKRLDEDIKSEKLKLEELWFNRMIEQNIEE